MILNKAARKLVFTLIIFASFSINAQEITTKKTTPKLEYQTYGGSVIIHHTEMNHLDNNIYLANELRLGFQTTGTDYWHKTYKLPTYGIGLLVGTFNSSILGKPRALFIYTEIPFVRKNKSYFSTSWSAGISCNLNKFDSIINPDNIAIGSSINAYIDFSLMYKHKLSKYFQLGSGIKLQHFSNGYYSLPNLGLNVASAVISLSYLPGKIIKEIEPPKPDINNKYEIISMVAVGLKAKSIEERDEKYLNSTVSLSINKRVNAKRTFGVGLDYFYQTYLVNYYDENRVVNNKDLMSYAGFISSEMIMNKLRIVTQFGIYLHRPVDFGLFFYERFGLRFYPTKWMFANISIKAHAAKAGFIEWGLGFNL